MSDPTVIIIGGGAAGLTAAIAASRHGARVTVLEAGPRVGRKILPSGNGRCNLSNLGVAPEAYNAPDFVAPVLEGLGCRRVLELFSGIGLVTYADDEGRVYPASNAANSVLDVLRLECARLGVEERVECEVVRVERAGEQGAGGAGDDAADAGDDAADADAPAVADAGGWTAVTASRARVAADAVVVATGGGSALLAGLGHDIAPSVTVLGPIKTDAALVRRLSGVRVRCEASLLATDGARLATERGELLFRDYGVSGILVFDLSRFLDGARWLSIDLQPELTAAELESLLTARITTLGWRDAETFFDGMLHPALGRALIATAGVELAAPASSLDARALAAQLKDVRLEVTGGPDAKAAQVTRGGARLDGFDAATLESRVAPGVFAAGEALDVDGRCGGFNLHWAWASGMVAGMGAARVAGEHGAPTGAAR